MHSIEHKLHDCKISVPFSLGLYLLQPLCFLITATRFISHLITSPSLPFFFLPDACTVQLSCCHCVYASVHMPIDVLDGYEWWMITKHYFINHGTRPLLFALQHVRHYVRFYLMNTKRGCGLGRPMLASGANNNDNRNAPTCIALIHPLSHTHARTHTRDECELHARN